jgi:hypothetical protein
LLEWVVEEPARNVRDQLLARAKSFAQEIEREMGNAKG